MSWKPDCFLTEKDYDDWIDLYIESMGYEKDNGALFCMDCTLVYQSEMIKKGLCMYPERKTHEKRLG